MRTGSLRAYHSKKALISCRLRGSSWYRALCPCYWTIRLLFIYRINHKWLTPGPKDLSRPVIVVYHTIALGQLFVTVCLLLRTSGNAMCGSVLSKNTLGEFLSYVPEG
ncbi:hypothetical protein F4802DRAFT_542280 [Xylaria palmicola]|nr:hypothetical protein F4802DRAFT_542280 [Xylaria palmicola]